MIKTIKMRLGNMRKFQEFVVYPDDGSDSFKIQSNDCIALVNKTTGEARWTRNRGGAYFLHLSMGGNLGKGTEIIPADVLKNISDCLPKKGDEIGKGVFIG